MFEDVNAVELVTAAGVLWLAFRLERLHGVIAAVQGDVRAHVNTPGLHGFAAANPAEEVAAKLRRHP